MSDSGLHGSRAPRPHKNKAKPGDTVLPVTLTCPCGCGHTFTRYVWIDIQSIPELERDELGQVVKDAEGNPKEKLRMSHSYISVPRIHPAWVPEMEPELRVLYERSQAEREFAEKHKKPETIAEAAS